MKTKLSCDNLFLIQACLDEVDARLERLHWQIVPYMPFSENKNKKETEGQIKVLRNIQKHRHQITQARAQIGKVFEEQYVK